MRVLHEILPLVVVAVTLSCELLPAEEPPPTFIATPPATTIKTNVWVAPQTTQIVNQTPTGELPTVPTAVVNAEPNVMPNHVANGVGVTTFQLRQLLGHYTTLDGKTGFVLDRTVDPPRARIDGDPYVKNLDVRPSIRCCVEYAAGGLWMRVDKDSGAILEFQGSLQRDRSVRVIRDADAAPLPTP